MNEQKLILADLASGLSHRASLPMRYSEDFVRSFFKIIEDGLMRDNLVKIKGFGTFKLIDIEARESINVNTGERFEIAGHTKVSFTPDPTLRDAVNRPFVEFDTVILNEGTDTALMEATDDDVVAEKAEEQVAAALLSQQPEVQEENVEAPVVAEEVKETLEAVEEVVPPVEQKIVPEDEAETPAVEEPVTEAPTEVASAVDEPAEAPAAVPSATDEEQQPIVEEQQPTEKEAEIQEPINTIAEMEKKNNHNALWLPLTALLFTIIGYCLGYYWHPVALPELCSEQTQDTTVQTASDEAQPAAVATPAPTDSIAADTETTEAPAADLSAATADYPQIEGGEYMIVGVLANDTMKVGKMLTKMAIQYYGDKSLYTYICKMNGIDNPDVVPLNKPLLIPKLQKK